MPEMTDADLARIRRAVQLRDRCAAAAVADGARLGIPLTPVQANVAYDAMAEIIRAAERDRGTDRAQVVWDPAMRFGRAQIKGVSCEAIGGMVWAGESVESTAQDYDLTRPEVIVAC